MIDAVLVLNAGSSSVKYAVYPVAHAAGAILRGKIAGIGTAAVFSARDGQGQPLPTGDLMAVAGQADHATLIPALLTWLQGHAQGVNITAAGHRVVHGGRNHAGPARITPGLMAGLQALAPLAPLHQPHNLAAIRLVAATMPDLPQIGCFDSIFHRSQRPLAQMFALPQALTRAGIIRYGFHGLSYDYIASTLPDHLGGLAQGRVIVAHLGSGASLCAIKQGQSVATSMGFTALDGLVMGRRCGALDPGVVLYLMQQMGMDAAQVSNLLYTQSGLFGVSGISSDMAVLQASNHPDARQAIDLFCHRAAAELASLVTALGGLDALVFTAGIGENSPAVRAGICDRLAWMGVRLDAGANDRNATRIGAGNVQVLVIPTDEEAVIARATRMI
ncbi:MAG: acetate/propionate family kinase [Paracoccus sp. (in: a-proteobacteria)]|nr:acetate/propionate family kinase [Paracoccus sp. (in: a-proteobacteria)]